MDTVSIIGIILGSNVIIEVVKQAFIRRQTTAGTIKLTNEAGQIVIEGELKVSEFYKKEWQELLARYEALEKRLDEKQKEISAARVEMTSMQKQYTDLQRELTLLRTKFQQK